MFYLELGGAGSPPVLIPPSPSTETGNYTCEFCGKQYKYYTPYQEHVALHAPISESLLHLGAGETWGGAGVSHWLELWSYARVGASKVSLGLGCQGSSLSHEVK